MTYARSTTQAHRHRNQFPDACHRVAVMNDQAIEALRLGESACPQELHESRRGANYLRLVQFCMLRLELGQILYGHALPWVVADEVLGGASHFLVRVALWDLMRIDAMRGLV